MPQEKNREQCFGYVDALEEKLGLVKSQVKERKKERRGWIGHPTVKK